MLSHRGLFYSWCLTNLFAGGRSLFLTWERETTITHQRLDTRIAATELAVGFCRIDSVAWGEQVFHQLASHFLIVETTFRFREGF